MNTYTKRVKLTSDEFKKVDEVHQGIRKLVDYYANNFRKGEFPDIKVEYITSMKITTLASLYKVLFYIQKEDERRNVI